MIATEELTPTDDLLYAVFSAAQGYYDTIPNPKISFMNWYYGDGGLYDAAKRAARRIKEGK
jgi:hypothetical protein